ncbi:MAG TPA: hypothetical protein VM580_00405 [Labilithrix sp.]|nr:hypothetical protein [Labilithrix sp.]
MVAKDQKRPSDELAARVIAAWAEHDAARALHSADRDAIHATEAARSLVLELFGTPAPARDLFTACARLGALMAEAGASPSLAAGVIDNAARALSEAAVPFDPMRVSSARASLIEGYVATIRDIEHAAALTTWEYPSCAIPLGEGVAAIACGYPSDDAEVLAAWATRLAARLVRGKVRCIVVSGPEPATAEVASAAQLVGIDVARATDRGSSPLFWRTPPVAAAPKAEREGPPSRPKSWLRLPWRK